MSRLFTVLWIVVVSGVAAAQLDRRSRDEPEMFVEAGGRSGTCDAMLFSPDGKYLYAGGDDKCVRVWPVGGAGLETGRMRTLRWPAWRDQRGGIKTLALPSGPGDRRVLVAGFGMKNGLVVVLDAAGEILATNEIAGQRLPPATVMASTFAPDGKSAVYGTADGRIWSWDLAATNRQIGRHSLDEGREFNRPRLIRFLDDNRLISVAESGQVLTLTNRDGRWEAETTISVVDQFHKALQQANKKPPEGRFRVYRADLSPDGKWLAVSFQPNYLVWTSLDGGAAGFIRVDTAVRALAIDRRGLLAYATVGLNTQSDFRLDTFDTVRIVGPLTGNGETKPQTEFQHSGRAEALAWHPDGLMAIAGGDDHEVTLRNFKSLTRKPAPPLQVVRGKGRGIWDVRIGKNGETFLFRAKREPSATDPNQRGDGPWLAFDFAIGKPTEPGASVPLRDSADSWSIEPAKDDPMTWLAVHRQSGVRHALKLDPDRDEQPRCFCFLPASGKKPTRVLVGHYYGFSLFELTADGAKRTMLGTGQAGDVMSIATDADGTWFVTGSVDQTIAGWSLADWPSGPFGAKFEKVDGRLMVLGVDLGGPAWEMGLSKGDEILLVARADKDILFGRAGKYQATTLDVDLGSADAALAALSEPTAGIEHYLGWKRGPRGDVIEGLTTLRRRPLWRFFPAFDSNERFDHWVCWMWKGGHYATSTSGDYLVGWQLNDPDTITRKKPEFYLASRFKGVLHKKLAVLRLMQSRNLPATLVELAGDNPQPPKFGNLEPAPVQLKLASTAVDRAGVRVDIQVAARGHNPDLLPERVELWVNDHRVKQWEAGGKAATLSEIIPSAAFRRGENEVTVLAVNPAGGRGEARQKVTSELPEQKPRLIGLFVGINDYSRTAKNPAGAREFGNLNSANNDARKLSELWKSQTGAGRLFAEDRLIVTVDPKAYQKDILAALDALANEARPEDRVVVFLAGHGDFVPKPDAAKGADQKLFVFCCPDYSPAKWQSTGVSGEMIFERLARCPGRKLLLIDACHSGQAASENMIRHLVPEGHGPSVIAACDQKELSFEHPKIGHGLFTAAILEALGDKLATADRSGDGTLDPQELFDYVRGRMPSLLKESGKPERIQNPQAFPPDLARFPIAGK
jgi:WD40 repeat protein